MALVVVSVVLQLCVVRYFVSTQGVILLHAHRIACAQDGALTPEMEQAAMATADKLLGLSGSGVTKSMQIVVTSFDQV